MHVGVSKDQNNSRISRAFSEICVLHEQSMYIDTYDRCTYLHPEEEKCGSTRVKTSKHCRHIRKQEDGGTGG